MAVSSGSHISCACSLRSGTPSVDARCSSTTHTGGVTPTKTSRPTSTRRRICTANRCVDHGETQTALRYVRRHYITRDDLRREITQVVDATFEARDPRWRGMCASDSWRADGAPSRIRKTHPLSRVLGSTRGTRSRQPDAQVLKFGVACADKTA